MLAEDLSSVALALCESYAQDGRAHNIGGRYHPSRDEMLAAFNGIQRVFFPGIGGGTQHVEPEGCTTKSLEHIRDLLTRQIAQCLCLRNEKQEGFDPNQERTNAASIASSFLKKLPDLRRKLLKDAQAALDGDPAAQSLDEIILAYPGFLAVCAYRVAHELVRFGVPLLPRMLSEWAHAKTGADIHPGASIGDSFFIDHATGVVIGETSHIGARVRLYQGVTLGAMSLPRDATGRVIRHNKRHPTVEDDVTIYANATVLGGTTVLGRGSVVGGGVFLTKSIPAGSRIAMEPPKLLVGGAAAGPIGDFEI